jgi:hypothetical protein
VPRKAGHPNTGDLLGSIRTNDGERSLQTPGDSNHRETVQTTPFLRWKRRMVQADFEGAGSLRALSLQRVVPIYGDPFECIANSQPCLAWNHYSAAQSAGEHQRRSSSSMGLKFGEYFDVITPVVTRVWQRCLYPIDRAPCADSSTLGTFDRDSWKSARANLLCPMNSLTGNRGGFRARFGTRVVTESRGGRKRVNAIFETLSCQC